MMKTIKFGEELNNNLQDDEDEKKKKKLSEAEDYSDIPVPTAKVSEAEDYSNIPIPNEQTQKTVQKTVQKPIRVKVQKPQKEVKSVVVKPTLPKFAQERADLDKSLSEQNTAYNEEGEGTNQTQDNRDYQVANKFVEQNRRYNELTKKTDRTKEEDEWLTGYSSYVNQLPSQVRLVDSLTEQEKSSFNVKNGVIQEGLIGGQSIGLDKFDSSGLNPTQEGGKTVFEGVGVVTLSKFAGLTGEEYRRGVAGSYVGFLTDDKEIQEATLNYIAGQGRILYAKKFPDGEIPHESLASSIELNATVSDGTNVFGLYEDKEGYVYSVVQVAKMLKSRGESLDKIGEYLPKLEEAFAEDNAKLKEFEDIRISQSKGETDRSQSVISRLLGIPILNFTGGGNDWFEDSYMFSPFSGLYQKAEPFALEGWQNTKLKELGKPVEPYSFIRGGTQVAKLAESMGFVDKELNSQLGGGGIFIPTRQAEILNKMIDAQAFKRSNIINGSIQKFYDSNQADTTTTDAVSLYLRTNPVAIGVLKVAGVKQENIDKMLRLPTGKIGMNIVQLLPAFVPYVGQAYIIGSTVAYADQMPTQQGRNMLTVTALTLGASKLFSTPAVNAIAGKTISASGQTLSNLLGAGGITYINADNYIERNTDGTIKNVKIGEMLNDNVFDVAQFLGKDAPSILKAFKRENPTTVSGLIIRNGDTGEFHAFVSDSAGLTKLIPISEDAVETFQKQATDKGKPIMVQTLNTDAVKILYGANPTLKDRIKKATLGTKTRNAVMTETDNVLKVDGKDLMVFTYRDFQDIPKVENFEDRSFYVLDALSEPNAKVNVNLLAGDLSFVQTIKNLRAENLIFINSDGLMEITPKGTMFLEKTQKAVTKVRTDFESSVETVRGEIEADGLLTTNVVNKRLEGMSDSEKPIASKFYAKYVQGSVVETLNGLRDEDKVIRLDVEELMGMGEVERKVIADAVALGKLNYKDGVISNSNYTDSFSGKVLSFGDTVLGKKEQMFYQLGKTLKEGGNTEGLVSDLVKITGFTKEEIINTGKNRFEEYNLEATAKIAEYDKKGIEGKYGIDLTLIRPDNEVIQVESTNIVEGTKASDSGGFDLYHASNDSNLTIDSISVEPRQTKQGKKGEYGGFYTYDRLEDTENFAKGNNTSETYGIKLKKGVEITDYSGQIERLTKQDLDKLRSEGVKVIRGKSLLGRTEIVVIDKNAIESVTNLKSKEAPKGIISRVFGSDKALENTAVKDIEFTTLKDGEQLPEKVVLRDKGNKRLTIYERYGDADYRNQSGGVISVKGLEDLAKSDKFEYGVPKGQRTRETATAFQKSYPKEADNIILSPETDKQNLQVLKNGKGEFALSNSTKVEVDKSWSADAPVKFVKDKSDNSTFYVNSRALTAVREMLYNITGKKNIKDDVEGFAETKSAFKQLLTNMDYIPERIKNRFSDTEWNEVKNLVNEVLKADSEGVILSRFNPERAKNNYQSQRNITIHERRHKLLIDKTGSKVIFKDNETASAPFETEAGKRFVANLADKTKSKYPEIVGNHTTMTQEVIAFASDKNSLRMLGVDVNNPKEVRDFMEVYYDTLKNLEKQEGSDIIKTLEKYEDPEIGKLVEEIRNDRLETSKRGLENSSDPLERGSNKSVHGQTDGELSVKSNEWEGSGRKFLRIRRLTADGNPFTLTGIRGAEHNQRVRDGATPTINFFVERPDGTFVYEPELRNPRLIPFDTQGEFNLADLYTDSIARDFYLNNTFPKFQEWAESQGFDGFYNSNPDVNDAFRYRASLFDNDVVRGKINGELAIKSNDREINNFLDNSKKLLVKGSDLEVVHKYIKALSKTSTKLNDFVDNNFIKQTFDEVLLAVALEKTFEKSFSKNEVEISRYLKEVFPSKNTITDEDLIKSYQSLRQRENPLRNSLKLMGIRNDAEVSKFIREFGRDFYKSLSKHKVSSKELAIKADVSDEGFYSPIEEALNNPKFPKKANGEQYLNLIKNSLGVKREELEWSGIQEFLEGKGKVSLEEVRDFMKQSRVTVKEEFLTDTAKYNRDDLVLSGERKNDVEILLSVPRLAKGQTDLNVLPKGFEIKEEDIGFSVIENGKVLETGISSRDDAVRITHNYAGTEYEPFIDPHWQKENSVVTIRGNERITRRELGDRIEGNKLITTVEVETMKNGVRTFHVEEIQSDLHQKGRQNGYKLPLVEPLLEVRTTKTDVNGRRNVEVIDKNTGEVVTKFNNTGRTDSEIIQRTKDKGYVEIYKNSRESKNSSLVPEAPFKENWHELGFKKALRYAVEKGFERMTWTTGKQQIDRYSNIMRQNVDAIQYRKQDGLIEIEATKDDKRVFETTSNPKGIFNIDGKDTRMEEIVGANIAKQIREGQESGSISGDDLSIGGQFHKFQYDEKIPNFAKKYIKKWGASVKQIDLIEKSSHTYTLRGEEPNVGVLIFDSKSGKDKVLQYGFKTDLEAETFAKQKIAELNEVEGSFGGEKVWAIDITPQMRESILEGQPLYMKADDTVRQEIYAKREEDTESVRVDRRMKDNYSTAPQKMKVNQIQEILQKGTFSVLTPLKEGMSEIQRREALANMESDLQAMGYFYTKGVGIYKNGNPKDSFVVYYPDTQSSRVLQFLGNKYDQESVLHGSGGKYGIETRGGQVFEGDNLKFVKSGDRTEVELSDGKLNFNIDIDWKNPKTIKQDLSMAELKFNQRRSRGTVLTLDEIRKAYSEGLIEDAQGNKIEPNTVFDREGKKVGVAEVDEQGRVFLRWDDPKKDAEKPVYLVDGIGKKGKDRFYVNKTRRDILGSIGFFQQLVKLYNPNIEFPVRPKKGSLEEFNIKRAEIVLNHIEKTLKQWENSDPNEFGASWYAEEAEGFAKRVGRDVKDVNNDVVKLWLFLTTASTSPNTSVPVNAGYAMNAISTLVRFYETGKLEIPIFQKDNQGNLMISEYSGKPAQLGLGSVQMEKTKLLTMGYVPFASDEGRALVKLGAEVKRADEILGDSIAGRNKFVKSETAQAMMDKYGSLQGVLNYLLSPSNTKPNKAVDIYGDKLGVFFSNLAGMSEIPTIDTWMNRYFMGLTGEALEVKRNKNGTIISIKDNSVNFDLKEGDFFRGIIQKATEDWNKISDRKLTPADTQAILWTQIKDLFNSLVTKEEENIDYSTAYDQIKARYKETGKEMPSAESNPQLLKDAENKAPYVKQLTETDWGKTAYERFYLESRDGQELAVKTDEGLSVKQQEIDMSDPLLEKGDFTAWTDVASRMVKGGHLSEGEIAKIKGLSDARDIEGLKKFVLGLNYQSPLELLVNLGRISLLLGVKNIGKNIGGNSLRQFMDEVSKVPVPVLDLVWMGINKALGGDNFDRSSVSPLELVSTARAYGKAMTTGLYEGLKQSYDIMAGKENVISFEHPSLFRDRTTGWMLLKPLEAIERFGWRLQGALDKPFNSIAYYRSLSEMQSIRMKQERAKGNKISYKEAENYLTVMDYQLAEATALNMTYQGNNKVAGVYYNFVDGLPPTWRAILTNITKFVKTPLNVVDYMLDYTGFWQIAKLANDKYRQPDWSGWKNTVKEVFNNPQDRKVLSMAVTQGAIGSAMLFIGFRMAEAGLITGFFDREKKKEREQMTAKGTSFGSIQIGGKDVDISWLSPTAFYLMMGGTMFASNKEFSDKLTKAQENLKKAEESGDEEKIKKAQEELKEAQKNSPSEEILSKFFKNMALQTPFLRQLDDIKESIDSGKVISGLAEKWFSPDVYVPAIVKEIAGTKDTTKRVINDESLGAKMTDKVKAKIPTLPYISELGTKAKESGIPVLSGLGYIAEGREKMPVQYDMLGRPIQDGYGLDPFSVNEVDKTPLVNELDRLNITIPQNFQGNSVSKNNQRKQKGDFFLPALTKAVESEQYMDASDSVKKEILENTIRFLNTEYRDDKLNPADEDFNLNVIREREVFKNVLKTSPMDISRERTITDKEIVNSFRNSGINTNVNLRDILSGIPNLDEFVKDNFNYNFMVSNKTSKAEAEKNMAEFNKDPEKFIILWWAKQQEREKSAERNKNRKEELTKQGKTEEEIEKILRKESSKRGWANRKKPALPITVTRPRVFDNFVNQRQSENLEDKR